MFRLAIAVAVSLAALGACKSTSPQGLPATAQTGTAAASAAAGGEAAEPAGPPQKVTEVEGIAEYRLANGMRVLLFPDASKDTVTVNVTYFVGSKHEGYGETGMAHLLEHMVFKGTPTHPDIWALLQQHGASFNGTTWTDRTNYYETLPATEENLEFAIRMEADRMVNSTIAAEDLSSEFSVVRNEFEMGENNPSAVLEERMFSTAFLWHNYGKSTIGTRSDIEKVPVENLRRFYETYYQPDNAMLVVAGKFDAPATLALINGTFGAVPKPARALPETHTIEPIQDGEREVTLRRVGDVGVVGVLYHAVPGAHEDFVAAEALVHALVSEPSGRLYASLVEPKLASRVWGSTYMWQEPSALQVFVEAPPEALEQVERRMLAVLDDIATGKRPLTDEEVKRYRTRSLKSYKLGFNDTQRIAVELSEFAALGDWRLLFVYRDRLEKLAVEQVQRFAQAYLRRSNATLGRFVPTDAPARAPQPEQPNVAALVDGYEGRGKVAEGEKFEYTIANIESRLERRQLGSGMKLALLAKETRGDAVRARLALHYGSAKDFRGKATAESLISAMLMRGTKTMTHQQIKDRLDELEAQVSIGGGKGTATVDISTTRDNLVPVIDLVAELLKQPSFPAAELEIIRQEQLAELEKALTDPQQLVFLTMFRTLNPQPKDDVRYVPMPQEQIERLKKVKLADVERLHQRLWGASHAEMTVVGDFDPDAVSAAVESHFGSWKTPRPYERIDSTYRDVGQREETIDTPDKEMAIIASGHNVKMKDSDPDYAAFEMINYVLGGSASSRLLTRLRQKDGLSYGAFSFASVESLDESGFIVGGAILAPQNAAKGMAAMVEEMQRLAAEGVPAEELTTAIASYRKEFQRDLSNDGWLLATINEGLYLGRDLTFHQQLLERIAKLRPAEVQAVLKEHFRPERAIRVTGLDEAKARAVAPSDEAAN